MMEFHNIDMTTIIPENFITLSVRFNSLNEIEIRGKYEEQIAEKLVSIQHTLEPMVETNNNAFAIKVEHYHYMTKDKNKATEIYHLEKDAHDGVRIIKELKNPNDTHKYSAKACIKEINKRIQKTILSYYSMGMKCNLICIILIFLHYISTSKIMKNYVLHTMYQHSHSIATHNKLLILFTMKLKRNPIQYLII